MNKDVFSRLHYHSGLVAQGCWDELDEYDREAIRRFGELIVKECLTIVDDLVDKQADGSWTSNELYTDYNGALHLADRQIKQHFGVEE